MTTAAGRDNLLKVGAALLFLASFLHNVAGYFFGYFLSCASGLDKNSARSIAAFEVGPAKMAAWRAARANAMGKLAFTVGLALAIFIVWMNIRRFHIGELLAQAPGHGNEKISEQPQARFLKGAKSSCVGVRFGHRFTHMARHQFTLLIRLDFLRFFVAMIVLSAHAPTFRKCRENLLLRKHPGWLGKFYILILAARRLGGRGRILCLERFFGVRAPLSSEAKQTGSVSIGRFLIRRGFAKFIRPSGSCLPAPLAGLIGSMDGFTGTPYFSELFYFQKLSAIFHLAFTPGRWLWKNIFIFCWPACFGF